MHLEGLVTSLDFEEHTLPDGTALIHLFDVFTRLPEPPDRLVVYFDLRRGAADSADVEVRVRKARGVVEFSLKLVFNSYSPTSLRSPCRFSSTI